MHECCACIMRILIFFLLLKYLHLSSVSSIKMYEIPLRICVFMSEMYAEEMNSIHLWICRFLSFGSELQTIRCGMDVDAHLNSPFLSVYSTQSKVVQNLDKIPISPIKFIHLLHSMFGNAWEKSHIMCTQM